MSKTPFLWMLILLVTSLPLPAMAAGVESTEDNLEDQGIEDEFAFLADEEIVESAARHWQEIGMSPSAITVLTREDIEASGAHTISDLLRLVPGMDVVRISPAFSINMSRLRWHNSNIYYLSLIDGRDATEMTVGQVFWETQPVSLEDIERIEIIRGPASSLYGANALSGLISITTRSVSDKDSVWAKVSGGESGLFSTAARGSFHLGKLGVSVSGEIKQMDLSPEFRTQGISTYKLRSFLEYRFSENERVSSDIGFCWGQAMVPTSLGMIQVSPEFYTLMFSYQSPSIRSRIYGQFAPGYEIKLEAPLAFNGIELARFVPLQIYTYNLAGDIQWTLPTFYEPLMFIVGGGAQISWLGSDQLLDPETFANKESSSYHQPGLDYLDVAGGIFIQGEYSPTDWVTATLGLRFDLNTITNPFLSPKLAVVFIITPDQFLRMGASSSFRRPTIMETYVHPMVGFPNNSPVKGSDQDKFLEFMSRLMGSTDLDNEKLWSFDVGYFGKFLDDKLSINLDLYYNWLYDTIAIEKNIILTPQGLPDLGKSSVVMLNIDKDYNVFGGELCLRLHLDDAVTLLASWSHKEIFQPMGHSLDTHPKNLITMGGQFRAKVGLVGSLYGYFRSEFWDRRVSSPAGILEPFLSMHMDNDLLILSKLGWQMEYPGVGIWEAGIKLFLPMQLSSPFRFQYFEQGGGMTPSGQVYGAYELQRMVLIYLEGSI